MGSQKIPLSEAQDILEHLEEALTLLDIHGQGSIGVHVQMAIDMLRNSADIDETSNGSEQHSH